MLYKHCLGKNNNQFVSTGDMKFQVVYYLCVNVFLVAGRQIPVGSTGTYYHRNVDASPMQDNVSDGKDRGNQAEEKWLVDAIYYDDYQSDATVSDVTYDFCPPVPDVTSDETCALDVCKSDMDCEENFRCCFNGCVFTCQFEVLPAPVLDWMKEPRRSRSGVSWLIPGHQKTSVEVESCSTAPVGDDEDPLLCPTGYFCHVDDSPDNKKRKPHEGYCVKQTEEQFPQESLDLILNSPLKEQRQCTVDDLILLEGASVRLKDKNCRCKKGFLSCSKRERKKKVDVKVKKTEKTRRRKNRRRDGEKEGQTKLRNIDNIKGSNIT